MRRQGLFLKLPFVEPLGILYMFVEGKDGEACLQTWG